MARKPRGLIKRRLSAKGWLATFTGIFGILAAIISIFSGSLKSITELSQIIRLCDGRSFVSCASDGISFLSAWMEKPKKDRKENNVVAKYEFFPNVVVPSIDNNFEKLIIFTKWEYPGREPKVWGSFNANKEIAEYKQNKIQSVKKESKVENRKIINNTISTSFFENTINAKSISYTYYPAGSIPYGRSIVFEHNGRRIMCIGGASVGSDSRSCFAN